MRETVAFLTTVLPTEKRGGGEVVTAQFVAALRASGRRVIVVGYARPGSPPPDDPDSTVVGTRAIETAGAGRLHVATWAAGALLRRIPYSMAKYRSRSYLRAARVAAGAADVTVIDHAQTGWVVGRLRSPAPLVLLAHNVEHELYEEGGFARRREAGRMRITETALARAVDAVWTLTEADATAFRRLTTAPVHAFAVPGRPAAEGTVERTRAVAVLGSWTWAANAHGLRWFCDRVVPHLPDHVTVDVAGAGADWCASVPGVRYHGRVADAAAFLASARVVAIPSTAGAGVQVKTLDALASGAWVVATPTAVRGLGDLDGVASVTDDAITFAATVAGLVDDDRTLGPCQAALEWDRPRRAAFADDVASALP